MKILKRMMTVGLVAMASLPLFAQSDTALATLPAELQGKLDTKNAKVGDNVVLKTTTALKGSEGNSIPRGAKLIGHITDVKAHDGNNADAQVAILFDRAEWKGGKSATIHALIESLQPVEDKPIGDAAVGGPVGGGGGRAGGGGMSPGGAPRTSPINPTAAPTDPNAQLTGKPTSDAVATAGNTTVQQSDGTTVKTIVARPTGIAGVFVASDAAAPNSGTIFAKGKNLHLDDGTMFTLGVAPAAAQ